MDTGERTVQVPITVHTGCLLTPPARPEPGRRPPLVVMLHGQAQSGRRQRSWMGAAVPSHFAAAYPDGFLPVEVRRPERPPRQGHAWYVYTGDRAALIAALAQAEERLWTVIDRAQAELDADPTRLWLGGFSQGAYLTHCAALHRVERVSGWFAQCGGLRSQYVRAPVDLAHRPVLLQHGRQDTSVPVEMAEQAATLLAGLGADVTLHLHDAGHRITPAMADEVATWLTRHEPER